jgi:2-C-methyl-D-erythritol 4-phosphate cytidylyltransferase
MTKKTVSAVLVAAGNGTRFGRDKLFLRLGCRTVLAWSVRALLQVGVDELVFVCHPQTLTKVKLLWQRQPKTGKTKGRFILGGSERWESSLLGIKAATGELVAIHDAARPLVEPKLIKAAVAAATLSGAALLAAPATDSIKLVPTGNLNTQAVARDTIYLAQTPQVFSRALILAAYQKALAENYQQMTDESELITRFLGRGVTVIPSSRDNLKITFPSDLLLARALAPATML